MKKLIVTLEDRKNLPIYHAHGVDEVVVALQSHTFSAFQEMNLEEICTFVSEVHQANMHISVLMDRLFEQHEIDAAFHTLQTLIDADVDYVMFADPALMMCAVENGFASRMIYRSLTMSTSSNDAKWWMDQGVASVVISSLITTDEIQSIASAVPHTSLVVHGYMLESVSKRPLLSNYKKTSGKEFTPKHNYHLTLREDHREEFMPVYEDEQSMQIYNDFIQCSFHEMEQFMNCGIERFEIDTTFLSNEMIIDTIDAYRQILDGGNITEIEQEYKQRYHTYPLSDGYYGQKTVK